MPATQFKINPQVWDDLLTGLKLEFVVFDDPNLKDSPYMLRVSGNVEYARDVWFDADGNFCGQGSALK